MIDYDYACEKCGFQDNVMFKEGVEPASFVYPHETPASWVMSAPEWCKNEIVKLVPA